MTERFTDRLVVREPHAPPAHVDTLLWQLGVLNAGHQQQASAVDRWLKDQGEPLPWLLAHTLSERGLPHKIKHAA